MLTNNFSEIIAVVTEQLKNPKRQALSSDDIRNVSLMLLGYLRLIKSGFKTKKDSTDPADTYYTALKNILDELTKAQSKLLDKAKKEFLCNFNSDFNALDKKVDLIPSFLVLDSNVAKAQVDLCMSQLKKCGIDLRKGLAKELTGPYDGFDSTLQSFFIHSIRYSEIAFKLLDYQHDKEFVLVYDLIKSTSVHYYKLLTYWSDIERINQQSIGYVDTEAFIDLLLLD